MLMLWRVTSVASGGRAPVRGACGVHDLYLVLTGGARVSRFWFS